MNKAIEEWVTLHSTSIRVHFFMQLDSQWNIFVDQLSRLAPHTEVNSC
jgi:hypothetical protein